MLVADNKYKVETEPAGEPEKVAIRRVYGVKEVDS